MIAYSEDNFENLYMMGIKLQPGARQADLYTLVLYNEVSREDQNRPLTVGDRIAFLRDPSQADRALGLADSSFRKYRPFVGEVACVYDVPAVLQLIAQGDRDEPAIIADFLNELLDFVTATTLPVPSRFRDALHALADFATFDKDFGRLLVSAPERRAEMHDAVLWCLGAILSRARLVDV